MTEMTLFRDGMLMMLVVAALSGMLLYAGEITVGVAVAAPVGAGIGYFAAPVTRLARWWNA